MANYDKLLKMGEELASTDNKINEINGLKKNLINEMSEFANSLHFSIDETVFELNKEGDLTIRQGSGYYESPKRIMINRKYMSILKENLFKLFFEENSEDNKVQDEEKQVQTRYKDIDL